MLREVARLFREEPDKIEQNRDGADGAARRRRRGRPARSTIGAARARQLAARQIGGMIDPVNGGMRGAPKFPQRGDLSNCCGAAGLRTGDDALLRRRSSITLDRICEGGIYDHLGGGFSRYSVDERWLVPHFEKMLYDNAQLLELLALAWQRSRQPAVPRSARARRSAGSSAR